MVFWITKENKKASGERKLKYLKKKKHILCKRRRGMNEENVTNILESIKGFYIKSRKIMKAM
jgi:hypothetical protein